MSSLVQVSLMLWACVLVSGAAVTTQPEETISMDEVSKSPPKALPLMGSSVAMLMRGNGGYGYYGRHGPWCSGQYSSGGGGGTMVTVATTTTSRPTTTAPPRSFAIAY